MEKEIKITPPEGYEIDKENSTFECIQFKPITKKWRDENAKINGYAIIAPATPPVIVDVLGCFNSNCSYATRKQAKSALAMARISQIMANDERFGGIVTDEEWTNRGMIKFSINCTDKNEIENFTGSFGVKHFLSFHTPEQRDVFLKENEDLVKDYLMID